MLQQKVQNRRPDALRGIGIIFGAALAVLAGSALFSRLERWIGAASSIGFILYGGAIAWFLMDRYVLGFIYTAAGGVLRVCRFYGRRERFMADVRLDDVLAYGAPEDVKARFPAARVTRATRPQCPFAPMALAYRQAGEPAILVLQPDDAMRARLVEDIRKYRQKP